MALDLLKFCFDNRGHLENYIDWTIDARTWGLGDFQRFLKSFQTEKLPTETVFIYKDGLIVGSGRIAECRPYPPQIMYFIAKEWEGKGLGYAIGKKLLEQAFEVRGYHEVEALVDATNLRSQALIERLGGVKHDNWYGKPHALKESGHMYVYRFINPDPHKRVADQSTYPSQRNRATYLNDGLYTYLISFLPRD